jgi:hypothetical protein
MQNKRNLRLLSKILAVGFIIAVLSYLFHPDAGHLSIIHNGQPIADSLVRFAAIPTFLVILGLAAILTFMLFLGIGVFMFMVALFVVLMLSVVIAPYFWPVLVIIVLIIALMSISHVDKG